MSEPQKDLRTRLKDELDTAEWAWLKPHLEREALIVVDEDLDLIETAYNIAMNDTEAIQDLMTRELLTKPTPQQITAWDADEKRPFQFLIIQPFVLIQAKSI